MTMKIPFNKPYLPRKALHYIEDAVRRGNIAGDGYYSRLCQRWFEERLSPSRVLLTTSCTDALELSALLCGVKKGDEVIVSPFTFTSSVNAFLLFGGKPRFVDIREDTLNIDEEKTEEALTPATKVIVPVHYGGVACEMDRINEIAAKYGVKVVEDAAHAIDADYNGKALGTLGSLGTFSFHETKNIICGEGGALVINDSSLYERAEILREKGTNRSSFFRGEVDKYTWVECGSSYLPSDLLAAFLYAQLEDFASIHNKRHHLFETYYAGFRELEEKGLLRRPVIPEGCEHGSHLFYLILPSESRRDMLIAKLKEQGIMAVFHYLPLHDSPMGHALGYTRGDFPVAEEMSRRLLRLPFYYELSEEEQQRVIDAVHHILLT